MKKFTVKATAVAIASVCGSVAFAGTITAPTAVTTYAIESLVNTTDITSPAVTYKMGVARTTAQDFTVIVKPSAGAAFTAGSCAAALPVVAANVAGDGAATVTIKRASAAECAYEVDVTTAFVSPAGVNFVNLTMTGLAFDSHTLATAGNTVGVTVGLWDLGETARIDNSADVSVTVGNSAAALSITAAQDTGTVANVNATNGPLFGFVVANDDTAGTAAASFVVSNNTGSTKMKPDGTTPWNFAVDGTSIAVTVAGTNFTALASNSPVTVTAINGVTSNATTTATASTFTLLPSQINAIGDITVQVNMNASGTASLGTTRSFGVSAVADVVTGADETLAGNSSWWVWSANAIQLSSPYMSTDAGTGVLTRFFFQNLGTTGATYSATCQAETGKTVTAGTAATGTLAAGQTVIDAKDVCSFSTGIRGSVTFTINAPAANIKGAYNLGLNGAASAFIPLERPYAAGTY